MSTARHPSTRASVLVGVVLVALATALVSLLIVDHRLVERGRPDLAIHAEEWIFVAAVISAAVSGAVVAFARPRHPVGWLFLGLAAAITSSGAIDEYTAFALLVDDRTDAVPRFVAVLGDASFIPWLVLVSLVLQLTPNGAPLPGRWSLLPGVTLGAGVAGLLLSTVSTRTLAPPYERVINPLGMPSISPVSDVVSYAAVIVVGLSLVAGALSVVLRFRRGSVDERRQLLWLTLVVAPMPLFVMVAFTASAADRSGATAWSTGGFIVLVPVAAGLSALRFQLYNVERFMSRAVAYGLLTAALVAVYATIVLVASRASGSLAPSPAVAATLGAVTAAVVAAPMRRWLQDTIDHRFNRRRFRVESLVRAAVDDPDAGIDLEDLFKRAFDDATTRIGYPDEHAGSWVDARGRPIDDRGDHVDVARSHRTVARIWFDSDRVEAETVRSAATLASTELDNVRLRAELARRITDLTASRRRIASAQRDERRRIERDLHDGAQQSLLGLALDLQAAQLSADAGRMGDALRHGVGSARSAVEQLRDLANGLHPAALSDGGLPGVLDDLARTSHLPLRCDVRVPRMPAALEFTAWLVISEAVVNAQKHADAASIGVSAHVEDGSLMLTVVDDGRGGACPDGRGLRGMRDRVEAAGGTVAITSSTTAGTRIEARLPCAS